MKVEEMHDQSVGLGVLELLDGPAEDTAGNHPVEQLPKHHSSDGADGERDHLVDGPEQHALGGVQIGRDVNPIHGASSVRG